MIRVEMESSTRNYLVRLLENYKEHLNGLKANKVDLMYELNNINRAMKILMGKIPETDLSRNIAPTNFIVGADSDD
ncbi:MAG: hypothetical protein HFJ12_01390 [Bacilli bacterium]|nr:hypothetical protein [Bacilli bacterium]